MNRPTIDSPHVVVGGPDGEIAHAVPVQVPHVGNRTAKKIIVRERRPASDSAGNLRTPRELPGAVQEQDVDRTAARSSRVVTERTDGQVANTVSVQVTHAR